MTVAETEQIRALIHRAVTALRNGAILCPDCGVGSISLGDELANWLEVSAATYDATALRVGPRQVASQVLQWAEGSGIDA